jgi:hypothetical protein
VPTILIVAGAMLGAALLVGALASILGVGPTAEDQQMQEAIDASTDTQFDKPRDEGDLV